MAASIDLIPPNERIAALIALCCENETISFQAMKFRVNEFRGCRRKS